MSEDEESDEGNKEEEDAASSSKQDRSRDATNSASLPPKGKKEKTVSMFVHGEFKFICIIIVHTISMYVNNFFHCTCTCTCIPVPFQYGIIRR